MNNIEQKYLQIKDSILRDMEVDEFKEWIYIDMFGNRSEGVQYFEDLRIELERIERYDLLIELMKHNIQLN
jgi:hypothetical protein